jgi:hypothetical protein
VSIGNKNAWRRGRSIKTKGAGKFCENCQIYMDRWKHSDGWVPTKKQAVYFAYWDRCPKCGEFGYDDKAKRINYDPIREVVWVLD